MHYLNHLFKVMSLVIRYNVIMKLLTFIEKLFLLGYDKILQEYYGITMIFLQKYIC